MVSRNIKAFTWHRCSSWNLVPRQILLRNAGSIHHKRHVHHKQLGQDTRDSRAEAVNLPLYRIPENDVYFLHSPSEFHETLLKLVKQAKREIVLVSLYIGNASRERDLISCIVEALSSNPSLTLKMLFDYGRGMRTAHDSTKSSLQLCKELRKQFGNRVQAHFFSVPWQQRFPWKYLKSKFQETVGVQHMKFYAFDEYAVISGANLSRDYFSNRQDRYMVIEKGNDVIQDVNRLIDVVSSYSVDSCSLNRPSFFNSLFNYTQFRRKLTDIATSGYKSSANRGLHFTPLLQFGQVELELERNVTEEVLKAAQRLAIRGLKPTLHLATGYFNLHPQYEDLLVEIGKAGGTVNVLTASPQANGFHSATGLASSVPQAYTEYERDFLTKAKDAGALGNIRLFEYTKPGWTFHSKGLWLSVHHPGRLRSESCNTATESCQITELFERNGGTLGLIGSSNFSIRSVLRDLELQFLFFASEENSEFIGKMTEERDNLWKFSRKVDLETLEKEPRNLNQVFSFNRGKWIKVGKEVCKSFF